MSKGGVLPRPASKEADSAISDFVWDIKNSGRGIGNQKYATVSWQYPRECPVCNPNSGHNWTSSFDYPYFHLGFHRIGISQWDTEYQNWSENGRGLAILDDFNVVMDVQCNWDTDSMENCTGTWRNRKSPFHTVVCVRKGNVFNCTVLAQYL